VVVLPVRRGHLGLKLRPTEPSTWAAQREAFAERVSPPLEATIALNLGCLVQWQGSKQLQTRSNKAPKCDAA